MVRRSTLSKHMLVFLKCLSILSKQCSCISNMSNSNDSCSSYNIYNNKLSGRLSIQVVSVLHSKEVAKARREACDGQKAITTSYLSCNDAATSRGVCEEEGGNGSMAHTSLRRARITKVQ